MAKASTQPDAAMMAVATRLARYLETCDARLLARIFASGPVTIVENFPPYLFEGRRAVALWSTKMRAHLKDVTALRHSFAPACDYSRRGTRVAFSLPTIWRGKLRGKPFVEKGGWALVLTKQNGRWRVRGYGWAVIASADR